MLRRGETFSGYSGLAALVMVACLARCNGGNGGKQAPETGPRLNLLLITIDTLRADRLGCYGLPDARTPTLDSLAATGYLFESAHAQITSTIPSHASIMTSLYVRSHGVYANQQVLDGRAVTLAEVLNDSGYSTAAILGILALGARSGVTQGFQTENAPDGPPRTAGEVTALAIPWLQRQAREGGSFLLWVHYYDPHLPYAPPERFRRPDLAYEGRFKTEITVADMMALGDGRIPLPTQPELRHAWMLYDGEISYVDSEIARVLGVLRELGLAKDTIVLVVADHGESHGDHGIFFDHFGLYEPTSRIPMITTIPGWAGGVRIRALVQSIDIMPTLLELLGLEIPQGTEGVSLVPVLEEPGAEVNAAAVSELTGNLQTSVRTSAWKLISGNRSATLHAGETRSGSFELYDLRADPGETADVAAANPGQASALMRHLEGWSRRREPRWGMPRRVDDETRRALEELGYLR
jgi:arylsulfatase A-like enzyme